MENLNTESGWYQFYLFLVDILSNIVRYYSRIHYMIARPLFGYEGDFESFLLSGDNVLLWIFTIFSIVISFALIFIPIDNNTHYASVKQRKRLRLMMPFAILIAPFPMAFFTGYAILYYSKNIRVRIKNLLSFFERRIEKRKSKEE
jgi:hypothetical protein